jgi:hypothetical protein
MKAILKAICTAWREGVREYRRQQHGRHIGDPFKI